MSIPMIQSWLYLTNANWLCRPPTTLKWLNSITETKKETTSSCCSFFFSVLR